MAPLGVGYVAFLHLVLLSAPLAAGDEGLGDEHNEAHVSNAFDVPPLAWAEEDSCQSGSLENSEQCTLSMRQLRGERRQAALAELSPERGHGEGEKQQGEEQWYPSCAAYGCGSRFSKAHYCQCNDACIRHRNCCRDFQVLCKAPASPMSPGRVPAEPVEPAVPEEVEPVHSDDEDPDCHTAAQGDAQCYKDIMWAIHHGIREQPAKYEGLAAGSTFKQFQYWFFKQGLGGCKIPCGVKPAADDPHAVLTRTKQGVPPPKSPLQYNGIAWPTMKITGTELSHFFAVGDWGGLAGQLPHNSQIIQYTGGQTKGPHTMGRYRTDAKYHTLTCTTPQMADCFGTEGKACTGWEELTGAKCCKASCGWNKYVDVPAQTLVATQMKKRAALSNPQYILNVGDNFYWGGLYGKCGDTPMTRISDITQTQFKWIFEDIYNGPGLDGKPWLTTLGNHDWGGRQFTAAWDQQIAYTWTSERWILPAAYWMQRIEYVDQNFSVEVFMIDSNVEDALENTSANPEHNICGDLHNELGASCSSVGGMPSVKGCHQWFEELWTNGSTWVTEKIANSTADWQILVTHFPCGHKANFYKMLHLKYGLDLMVTGHVHYQMMYWDPNRLGGMTCFITGGGGGITSENTVDMLSGKDHQYGFYDLAISKSAIGIESINWNGTTIGTWTVHPTIGTDTLAAKSAPCEQPIPGDKCYKAINWAKHDGIYGHPSWFPGLSPDSSPADFQSLFYKQHKNACGKPCPSE